MVNIKGGEAGDIQKLKKELKKSSGGGTWVRSIPKDDEVIVRFLTEPPEWFRYEEHYDSEVYYFPCIGADCPGCAEDARTSRRYIANVLDIENERVVPLKLPVTLANRLVARFERYGTLMDRDYILMRQGTGTNTIYDADTEPKSKRKTDKYELLDLEKVLVEQFEDAFGEDVDDEDDEPKASKKKKSRKAKRLRTPDNIDDDEDLDEEDEDEEEEEASASASRRRRRR